MKVAVSFLSSDNYKKCISEIERTKADFIHVDICDGKYVETKNLTLSEIVKLLNNTNKMLDVHLMVKEPIKYVDQLAMLNTNCITIHLDSCKKPIETIEYISSIGLKVGIAINPNENIDILKPYLSIVDQILVMSVYPGKGGQSFIPEVTEKIRQLNEIRNLYNFSICVDGGINNETISYLNNESIDMVVSGSFITNSEDFDSAIKSLR